MKKAIVCLLILALSLGLTSCISLGGSKPETFTVKDSMSITLEGDYKFYDPIEQIGNYSGIFDSSEAKIIVIDKPLTTLLSYSNGKISYVTPNGDVNGIVKFEGAVDGNNPAIKYEGTIESDDFHVKYDEYSKDDTTIKYESSDKVIISGDDKFLISEGVTVVDSVDDLIGLGEIPQDAVYDEDTGLLYYEHDMTILITEVSCVCYVYLNEGTVWFVEMIATKDDYAEMRPKFEEFAKSVSFAK